MDELLLEYAKTDMLLVSLNAQTKQVVARKQELWNKIAEEERKEREAACAITSKNADSDSTE